MMLLEARPLDGPYADLDPYDDSLREDLRAALDVDPESWAKLSSSAMGAAFDSWWDEACAQRDQGQRIPFVVCSPDDGRVLGTTSFLHIEPKHRTVEIGATFLRPEARSGPVNPQIKRLMLAEAFARGAVRVELVTDALNTRSQAAIAKLGAAREGVLRNHRITWTGRVRDTVVFSITEAEWPQVRDRLDERLADFA